MSFIRYKQDVGKDLDQYYNVKFITFPGGEEHVSLPTSIMSHYDIHLEACIRSSQDVMRLLLTVDAIRRDGHMNSIHLFMPYIPYARQDRVANKGEALSIAVFAKLINSINFRTVTVIDPHSSVSEALFNNLKIIPQDEYAFQILELINWDESKGGLISPDAGAVKKTEAFAKKTKVPIYGIGMKKRDTLTGKLSGFDIHKISASHSDILIVDDLCDGGGTFIGLAQAVEELYPDVWIHLFTTHGIYSKGFKELEKHFSTIICTNSFRQDLEEINNPLVKVINVYPSLRRNYQ